MSRISIGVVLLVGPVQKSLYRFDAARMPVDSEPLIAFSPVHEPDAVQNAASVDDQLRVVSLFSGSVQVDADPHASVVNVSVGLGGGSTLTVTILGFGWLSPAALVQKSV